MRILKLGELLNAIDVINLAAEESRGYKSKNIQTGLNNGINVLLEMLTEQIEKSESNETITTSQMEDLDFSLDKISSLVK